MFGVVICDLRHLVRVKKEIFPTLLSIADDGGLVHSDHFDRNRIE